MADFDAEATFGKMVTAGRALIGDVWGKIETFALPELKKICLQIAELADPASPWDAEEKKMLFDMQVRSAIGIIVAMTALTMKLVQDAINQVLGAVRDLINGAVGIALV